MYPNELTPEIHILTKKGGKGYFFMCFKTI